MTILIAFLIAAALVSLWAGFTNYQPASRDGYWAVEDGALQWVPGDAAEVEK